MTLRGHAASWVLTGKPDAAPLSDGAVVFDEATVVAVGPRELLEKKFPALSFERHSAVLTPGLVNAHVHLELSALRGQTKSGGGFGPWVASMTHARAELSPEQDLEAIDAAVSELLRHGTAAIGEVTNTLAAVDSLATAPLIGRVFHEVFGMRDETARAMRELARASRAARASWPANLSYVVAPHTLFSLHPEMVRTIVAEARQEHARTSLHLAEHAAERAYLANGMGPFADYLRARNVDPADWDPPRISPVAYAQQLGALARDVIAVHLCDATPDELESVRAAAAPVVACPRSNLFIELKLPPLLTMLTAGLRPGLGTDSLASNTTLDVLAEASALADRFPTVAALELFAMASWYGACALGLEHRVGALAPGLAPGLLAFECGAGLTDPAAFVIKRANQARRVLVRPAVPTTSHPLGGAA